MIRKIVLRLPDNKDVVELSNIERKITAFRCPKTGVINILTYRLLTKEKGGQSVWEFFGLIPGYGRGCLSQYQVLDGYNPHKEIEYYLKDGYEIFQFDTEREFAEWILRND